MEHAIEIYGGKIVINDSDHLKGTRITLIDSCSPFKIGNIRDVTIVVKDAGKPGIIGTDIQFNIGEVVEKIVKDQIELAYQ
jgi:hypothetical protein